MFEAKWLPYFDNVDCRALLAGDSYASLKYRADKCSALASNLFS